MNKLTDEELQAFFDKMSDDDLEKIESLAQMTRKKRKKKWASFEEIVSMYAD